VSEKTRDRWPILSPHLDLALDLDEEERATWLLELQEEDPALATELATLLEQHRALAREGFLEKTEEPRPEASLVGQTIGAYTLVSLIGQGGMGTVWLAHRSDGRFEGEAAVKLLNLSFIGRAAEERFRREGSILARLRHPHIAHLLDAGVSPTGQPYLILEYVEGEPIDRYCDRKSLGIEERSRLFLDVLEAVAHAHAHQVVHRDIKPSNVLVDTDGQVKLLDFGIAKLLEGEGAAGETTALTREAGRALTPEYAAPEQIAGGPITAATDVYSLGVLLYEVLVGVHPFDTRRLREAGWPEIERIIREEEPVRPSTRVTTLRETAAAVAGLRKTDPATLRRDLAGDLDWITLKALEKDPARRYATAAELGQELERHIRDEPVSAGPPAPTYRLKKRIRRHRLPIATAAAALALAGLGVFLTGKARDGRSPPSGVKRLAVLPFENLGPPSDDYFADGISDAVRGKLTSLPGIQVIARGSSTPYRKTTKTPRQIAKELGVGYLLTATVRWDKGTASGSRVHVTPELAEISSSGAPISKWQQPFDSSLTDVFQVQSDIATLAAQALGVALRTGEEKRLSERPTQSLAAYDAFLKGEEASKGMSDRNPLGLRSALGFYEEAVALDPGFAQAWARVSDANSSLYYEGTPSPELAERARQAAERAVALAPERPDGYLALGRYESVVVGDFHRALEQYAKGRRVAPGSAELLAATGSVERNLGLWDAASEHLRQAERVDPRSVLTQLRLGWLHFALRRYTEAREALDRGLALAPTNLSLIECKAMTFLGQGNLAGARAVLSATPKEVTPTALVAYVANAMDLGWVLDETQRELLLRLTPSAFDNDRAAWANCLTQAHVLKGDSAKARVYAEEARKSLEEQLHATPQDAQRRVFLGLALAHLGRKEEAIREGRRGVDLAPVAKDAAHGPYLQHQLAKIYTLVGEPEKALDALEPLLKIPYDLSPAWLAIDPNFDPLRRHPRFQHLVSRKVTPP
jgi:eukaryotic-like serine/threonine-protein kinase